MSFVKYIIRFGGSLPVLLFPAVVAAQQVPHLEYFGTSNDTDGLLGAFNSIITIAIPILYALALLLFVWGVINYFILGAGDEGKRETGRSYMLYAIIGLVAITAVWGIVNLVSSILGVNGGTTPNQPDPPEFN